MALPGNVGGLTVPLLYYFFFLFYYLIFSLYKNEIVITINFNFKKGKNINRDSC